MASLYKIDHLQQTGENLGKMFRLRLYLHFL